MSHFRAWAWGNETSAFLESDMGWGYSNPSTDYSMVTSPVRTYAGSPTRYAMRIGPLGQSVTLPAYMQPPGAAGVVSIDFTVDDPNLATARDIVRANDPGSIGIYCQANAGGTVDLYVANQFKATSSAYDWSEYHQVAVAYDFSANPWRGRLEIDGVVEITTQTHARAASTLGSFLSAAPNGPSYLGSIRTFDDFADSPPLRFMTRIEGTADGTDVGTWTPDSGANNFSRVDSPVEAASYTDNAATTPGDYLEVTGSSLATQLGITPGSIDALDLHVYATTSSSGTIDARLSDDGATFADGADEIISGTTNAGVSTTTRPGAGGAWTGADTPTYRVHVIA